ncbi:MAG: LysE family translocator [Telmatospirillum sp.]|nr:LysE family translocator [Telmatospirillum sp.]
MPLETMLVFAATVLPIVCTPGPDILFISSQGLSGRTSQALRATLGVLAGYVAHAVLSALGVAAVVAASPVLFELLRWVGVAYLVYLAGQMIRSALRSHGQSFRADADGSALVRRGFLTSFLNPKGLMVYFAILPNFMTPSLGIALQALTLSSIFIGMCAVMYSIVAVSVASMGRHGSFSERRRRYVEGTAGGLLVFAASQLALG